MSTGYHGHGSTLAIGGTAVGQIMNINGPNESRDSIDISNMGSSAKWREFLPGMLDAGECTIDMVYDGSTNAQLVAVQATQTAQTITVTFPDATNATWTASGFITSLGHTIPYDDKITQSVGFKFTGARSATPY
jgi:predicted secreted protein